MPKGPNGEWRPADPLACAAHVMKIATGEEERAAARARASKAGKASRASQTPERRKEVAAAAADARWRATP